jgi:uncharacterized membrane protein
MELSGPLTDGRIAVRPAVPSDAPAFLGYNRLRAKPGAAVLLAAGDDPFLVLDAHGSGRVAAFASDCSPHWGPAPFTGWEHYARFWSGLVAWLAHREGAEDTP